MKRTKITKGFLHKLSNDTSKDVFHRDSELPGFGVKVTPRNSIVFIAEARIKNGRSKRVTLGKHPVVTLEKARELAQQSLMIMKQGDDPVELDRLEREERAKAAALQDALAVSLRSVFEDFLKARNLKPKTVKDYRNTVERCFASWMEKPVRSISRRDVEQRFFALQETAGRRPADTGKAQAAKAMRYLSSILNYAKADEIDGVRLITDNPCEVLKDKKIDRRIEPRKRYLERDEVRDLLDELSHIHHHEYQRQAKRITNTTIGDYITLILFTGLRRDEAGSLEWERVNFDDRLFSIEDTKNGTTHVVPMSPPVEALLQRRANDDSRHARWVFPAKRGDGHLVEPRKQIERICELTGVKFTSHDLRRTFATVAESYGLDYQTIKRALNHKTSDITERYIQTRAEKMRQAFDAIAEEIQLWAFDLPPESKMSDEEKEALDELQRPQRSDVEFETRS